MSVRPMSATAGRGRWGGGHHHGATHASANGRLAFTLLELLVVLAMVGVLAGLVIGTMGSAAVGSRQRMAIGAVHGALAEQRVLAMDLGQPRRVLIRRVDAGPGGSGGPGRFEIVLDEPGEPDEPAASGPRALDAAWLTMLDERETPVREWEARFDRRGRTTRRVLSFVEDPGRAGGARGGNDRSAGSGVVAALGFDPVSGQVQRWTGQQALEWYEASWRERQ